MYECGMSCLVFTSTSYKTLNTFIMPSSGDYKLSKSRQGIHYMELLSLDLNASLNEIHVAINNLKRKFKYKSRYLSRSCRAATFALNDLDTIEKAFNTRRSTNNYYNYIKDFDTIRFHKCNGTHVCTYFIILILSEQNIVHCLIINVNKNYLIIQPSWNRAITILNTVKARDARLDKKNKLSSTPPICVDEVSNSNNRKRTLSPSTSYHTNEASNKRRKVSNLTICRRIISINH